VTEYPLPNGGRSQSIVVGSDGKLWFTDEPGSGEASRIGSITIDGTIKEFVFPNGETAGLIDITEGPDHKVWFTELGASSIGSCSTDGTLSEFPVPASPFGIAAGPDGNIWFTETSGKVGRFLLQP